MTILSQTELEPLQEARRCAEIHLDSIRAIALARLKALPGRADDAENMRYHKIAEVVGALQTIYDAVSELEFEEDQPPEPPEAPEPEEDEDEPEEDEDDEDEDEDED